MKADGSEPAALTDGKTDSRFPRWSPDGSQIIFNLGGEGDEQLNIMDADGTNSRKLGPGDHAAFGTWTKGVFTSMTVASSTRPPAATRQPGPTPVPPVAGDQPTQPPAGQSDKATLVIVNQLSITLHVVVSGPTPLDVNIGPNAGMTFTVLPGTYVATASAQEYNSLSHQFTLAPGGKFTFVIHG